MLRAWVSSHQRLLVHLLSSSSDSSSSSSSSASPILFKLACKSKTLDEYMKENPYDEDPASCCDLPDALLGSRVVGLRGRCFSWLTSRIRRPSRKLVEDVTVSHLLLKLSSPLTGSAIKLGVMGANTRYTPQQS